VPGGGASRLRSRDRLLLNTVTVIKAKGRRVRRRGPLGSR
jgi:hypothetical protein